MDGPHQKRNAQPVTARGDRKIHQEWVQSDREIGDPADLARLAAFEHAEYSPYKKKSCHDAREPQTKIGQTEHGNGQLGKKRIEDVIGGVVPPGPQAGPRTMDETQKGESLIVNDGLMRGAPSAHGSARERE